MPTKNCARCDLPFVIRRGNHKYCSDQCRWDAEAERQQERVAELLAATTKECSRCGLVHDKAQFHADARRPDGLFPYCKDCRRQYSRARPQAPVFTGDRAQLKRDREKDRRAAMSAADRSAIARRTRLWAKYRLTVDEYQVLLAKQGGVCAICEQPETRGSSKYGNDCWLAVDHDHACCPGDSSCGKCIRGLLCMGCNTGLGSLRDSEDLLFAALHYVEQWSRRRLRVA